DFANHPTGTGPFMLSSLSNGVLSLVRNPKYNWGPSFFHAGPAYLDGVNFTAVSEDATRLATLQNGQNQLIDAISDVSRRVIVKDPNLKVLVTDPRGMSQFIFMDIATAPTTDINVRQAIAYGINAQEIVDKVYGGNRTVSLSLLEKGMLGYQAR